MRVRLTLAIALASAACLGGVALAAVSLDRFVARPGEETGFAPQGKPDRFRSAHAWLVSGGETGHALKTDMARLKREGFVAAVVQHMRYQPAPNSGGGLSLVVELGSAKSAKDELPVQLREDIAAQGHDATIRHFTISEVHGAQGFTATGPGAPALSANALFTEGRCLLLVGADIPNGNPVTPIKAGVKAIYHRTNERCP